MVESSCCFSGGKSLSKTSTEYHRIMNYHNYPWTHSTGTVRNRFNHFSTKLHTDRSTFNVTAPLDGSCCRCSIPRRSGKVKCEFLENQIHEGQSDAIGTFQVSTWRNMQKYEDIIIFLMWIVCNARIMIRWLGTQDFYDCKLQWFDFTHVSAAWSDYQWYQGYPRWILKFVANAFPHNGTKSWYDMLQMWLFLAENGPII